MKKTDLESLMAAVRQARDAHAPEITDQFLEQVISAVADHLEDRALIASDLSRIVDLELET